MFRDFSHKLDVKKLPTQNDVDALTSLHKVPIEHYKDVCARYPKLESISITDAKKKKTHELALLGSCSISRVNSDAKDLETVHIEDLPNLQILSLAIGDTCLKKITGLENCENFERLDFGCSNDFDMISLLKSLENNNKAKINIFKHDYFHDISSIASDVHELREILTLAKRFNVKMKLNTSTVFELEKQQTGILLELAQEYSDILVFGHHTNGNNRFAPCQAYSLYRELAKTLEYIGVTDDMADTEKHDKICRFVTNDIKFHHFTYNENLEFKPKRSRDSNVFDVLFDKRGVCYGKADVLSFLHAAAGIRAESISVVHRSCFKKGKKYQKIDSCVFPYIPVPWWDSPIGKGHAIAKLILDGEVAYSDPTFAAHSEKFSLMTPEEFKSEYALLVMPPSKRNWHEPKLMAALETKPSVRITHANTEEHSKVITNPTRNDMLRY